MPGPSPPHNNSLHKHAKAPKTGPHALKTVAELIQSGKAKNIVVLTGAGISTSAGIPDFRSPETGLYANLQALNLPFPEAVFELNYFRQNPKPFWTLAKELYPGKHFPTPTHYFLKLLDDHGVLSRVFTQNIDTLEHLTDLAPERIIEAHGSFASAHCLECGHETSTEYVLASGVRKGEVVYCPRGDCGGLVKPDIVFFGEGLPDKFFDNLNDLSRCDLLIVIGTSLQVQPFSLLPHRVPDRVPRVLINREAVGPFEALDSDAKGMNAYFARITGRDGGRPGDLFWKGDADDGVRELCEALGWGEKLERAIEQGRRELNRKWDSMMRVMSLDAGVGENEGEENEEDEGDEEDEEDEVEDEQEEEDEQEKSGEGGAKGDGQGKAQTVEPDAQEAKIDAKPAPSGDVREKTAPPDIEWENKSSPTTAAKDADAGEGESDAPRRARAAAEKVGQVTGKSTDDVDVLDELKRAIEKDLKIDA
ncbi:DHS-like NAD/FAD-binding domain-containing protein [Papiliotrema laurentii]|uniref:DHS-like NAD/FAD-binding domain-containing protein n=1 Tax=Papiliotrema laurentii TaxID=5418 RepID=A0AAD9FMQ9_PAPLA|nr:DHS-like NAD/FAD-binding domain-containing protein [Papiliotrema laurentii]